jgi:hypothetical protein
MRTEEGVKKRILVACSLALLMGTQVMARDLSFVGTTGLNQSNFRDLSREAGAAISYHNVAPAESLGKTGFDIGAELTAVDIKNNSPYWNAAFGNKNDAPSYLLIPKLRARKGLPFGIDVGAMYSYVPDTNIHLYGVEVSKSIIEGSVVKPALGIRGTYTRIAGVHDLDLQTAGLDASISKGILFLTPYAGAGGVWIHSKATGNLQSISTTVNGVPLKSEDLFQPRFFAGLKVSPLPLFGITAEAEYQERPIYSLKAAFSF